MADDRFGVKMIYPTKSGGSEWYLNDAGTNLRGESLTRSTDAAGPFYRFNSSQVRGSAVSNAGYSQSDINMNHDEIDLNVGGTGHMMKGGGWRDLEMTGYWRGTQSSGDTEYVQYVRGGTHTDGRACEGFAYKAAVDYNDGRVRIRKEQWHVKYTVVCDWRTGFGGPLEIYGAVLNLLLTTQEKDHLLLSRWKFG